MCNIHVHPCNSMVFGVGSGWDGRFAERNRPPGVGSGGASFLQRASLVTAAGVVPSYGRSCHSAMVAMGWLVVKTPGASEP